MSRQLRVQFPGAIYHVTSRGDRRQAIVVDDVDRDTFFQRIGNTVEKYAWQMFAAVLMTNHFHLFFRTPDPNLSRGMQFLLGGYASWWNTRHDYTGHVFQGRFRGHIVEDETYFWTVSRYAHLNPSPVLVERPEHWKWSSYAGYVDPSLRLPWIDYDALLNAWQGTFGGESAAECYRHYVEAGLQESIVSPFEQAMDGWILGSASFADRMREMLIPQERRLLQGSDVVSCQSRRIKSFKPSAMSWKSTLLFYRHVEVDTQRGRSLRTLVGVLQIRRLPKSRND